MKTEQKLVAVKINVHDDGKQKLQKFLDAGWRVSEMSLQGTGAGSPGGTVVYVAGLVLLEREVPTDQDNVDTLRHAREDDIDWADLRDDDDRWGT